MPLLLSQVIQDNELGLEVIAGAAGIDARGPVTWIHTSELPDPSKWLRGGEILLTTGYGVRRAPKAQRRLISNLDALGCVGIGLGIGDWLKVVPAVMIEEADRRGFPLFTVPYTTPFSIVTKHVAQKIFEEQYTMLQPGVDPRRHILAQVLLGKDIHSIAQALAERVAGSSVLLLNYFGQLLAAHPSRPLDTGAIWRATAQHRHHDNFSMRTDDRTVTGAIIRVDELAEAVLLLLTDRALPENELALFEQTTVSIGLALRYSSSPRRSRRSEFSGLLRDIAGEVFVPHAVATKLAASGLDGNGHFAVIAISADRPGSGESIAGAVEDIIVKTGATPLVGILGEHVYAIVTEGAGLTEAIRETLSLGDLRGAAIGVSRPYGHPLELRHAMREADLALTSSANGGLQRIDELGFSGLIPYLRADKTALEAMARVLEPVRAHDRLHKSELMLTLGVFVENAFSPGASAKQLGIHRHTLSYRLQQIAQLTKRDIRNGAHVLELAFALSLLDGTTAGEPLPASGNSPQSK